MTLVKYGIASVFVTSAALLACGSTSDGGGAAGSSNSSAGANSSAGSNASAAGRSSGGSTSSPGGSGNTSGGSAVGGSGGSCGTVTDPDSQMCPAAVDCMQTKCKSQVDAATSTSGVCGSYIQCTNACDCDDTCISGCPQTSACQASLQAYADCVQSSCLNELFSCLGAGTGGAGSGGKTCADLSSCCATLTDATEKMSCTQVVGLNTDLLCGLAYSNFCG